MKEHLDIFQCPLCKGSLGVDPHAMTSFCRSCSMTFPIEGGVPLFFVEDNKNPDRGGITKKIKQFYEETPFPNYEQLETAADLVQKAERGLFAGALNKQIPFNAKVLEVGCGTGQLQNYLALAQRYHFGVDMCINSLKLANQFKEKNNIDRCGFYQMNLFKPIFKKESFHLVICNGVLHHTDDPYQGFSSIANLVKKDGFIIIGLYNKIGRLTTDIRRIIFRLAKGGLPFLDARLQASDVSDIRKLTWFRDQYQNPHESKHTMGEVLRWFQKKNFEFISAIPNPKPFHSFDENLFRAHPVGNVFDHAIAQVVLLLRGAREGGFFIMIGRKK